MENQAFTDWKGKPINKTKHGGAKATYFIHFLVLATNIVYIPNMLNLVTYLHDRMHADIASSSTMVTNFVGATCAFALLGGFLSDSYISRFKTMLIFGPIEFLGLASLALQAHLPSLQPPKCDTVNEWNSCKKMSNLDASILYLSLYTVALGEGCLRSSMASFGGDQFDENGPIESQQKSSFFNWYTFDISLGGLLGLIFIVWIENNKGWDYGFGVSALVILFGLVSVASGFSFYRIQRPRGSPLTRLLQVIVAAFKKRKLSLPENTDDLHQLDIKEETFGMEVLSHTSGLEFLDKAAISHGSAGAWSLSTVSQVEETKIIIRMLPIFLSSLSCYLCVPLLLTFTVQQGNTMNTKLGKIHFSPASLMIIPQTFQIIFLVLYDTLFVPFARKFTGYRNGITQLQRISVGFISISFAMCVAALVERKRKRVAELNGLIDSSTEVPISVFWLGAQLFFIGISDVTSFVGLLEFFVEEASMGMKSMGTAIFYCLIGLSSLLATFVVEVVNKATRNGEEGMGWLDGNNLNKSHLDNFYWLLSIIGFMGLINYLYWAKKYVYRHDLRIQSLN
ncbi:protein NRT1/ PTR FAMILY 4.3 isoform X1 [Dendrobium catenatum]|uniref:Putative peptide/nitrate transporter n=1 Tax=Dendrobium catenatum TaxID=906689 RepID=A0A2I0VPN8_9ASPA|nr:protein NRT1/ PTR FAMILY 4.3 isoform X1 [Dendrobium catenatum]XP_028556313.1 protein NRT1/ PTR FAMILY 4.3 isoform X1 [Dendrobium catenatum]XP_028556314.1 protein NRT1/ PTR FAMILY 4.3 isoform X1 [Dendrobium catenatum]PKU65353.1 putative peptide/nitrate transporter [Dendrobium catenatum]